MADPTNATQVAIGVKDVVQPMVTLVASFSGVYFAYLLSSVRATKERRDSEIGAINRAIVVLQQMYGHLETYRQESIEPNQGRPGGWLNAPIKLGGQWGSIRFDQNRIAFLLEKKEANDQVCGCSVPLEVRYWVQNPLSHQSPAPSCARPAPGSRHCASHTATARRRQLEIPQVTVTSTSPNPAAR